MFLSLPYLGIDWWESLGIVGEKDEDMEGGNGMIY